MHRVKALADFSRELLGMNKKSLGIDEGLAEGDRDPWIKVTGYRTCKVTNVEMGYNLKLVFFPYQKKKKDLARETILFGICAEAKRLGLEVVPRAFMAP